MDAVGAIDERVCNHSAMLARACAEASDALLRKTKALKKARAEAKAKHAEWLAKRERLGH